MSEIIQEGKIRLENNNYTDNIPLGAAASNVYFASEDKSLEDINYENMQSLNSLQEKDKELLKQNSELSLEDEKIKQIIEDMQKNCKEQDKVLQDELDIIDSKINNLQSENITFENNIIDIQVQQNSQKEKIEKIKENYNKVTTTLPTVEKSGADLTLENSTNFINKKFDINGQHSQEIIEGVDGTLIQDKNIIVKDVSIEKARLLIKGNHEQEKTNGRQLLNPESLLATTTRNGITFTNNGDGTFNVSGTATANTTLSLWDGKDIYEANHYFGLYSSEAYNVNTWNLSFAITYSDGTATKYITPTTPVNATNENVNTAKVVLYIANGVTINKNNVKVMLYKDINTQLTEYEKYTGGQVAPSTNYPQEVKTVGGNINLLNNTGTTTTINGVNVTILKDKTILLNGTATESVNFVLQRNFLLKDGENYTLNSGNNNASSSKFGLYINQYYDNSNHILASYNSPLNFVYNIKSKDSNNIYVYVNKGVTIENELIKPKLEKGLKASPYSEYNQGSVEIIQRNENLLDIVEQTRVNNGTTATFKNGKITLTGAATSNWTFLTLTKTPFKLTPGEYTMDNLSGYQLEPSFWYSDTESKRVYIDGASKTFTIEKNVQFLSIGISGFKSGDILDLNFSIQLVAGKTLGEWKAPQSKAYLLPVQQEMLEGDFINSTEYHTWGKLVLDGTEPWYCESNGRFGYLSQNLPKAYKKTIQTSNLLGNVCNNYIEKTPAQTWTGTQGFCVDPGGSLRIWDDSYSKTSDLAGFKAMLVEKYNAGNPVICYLKLATPVAYPLTDEQKLIMQELKNIQLYTPITSFYSIEEESPLLSLKYNYVAAAPSTENISEIKATGDNVNYFNKNTLMNYILNEETGELIQQSSWRLSDFIPVEKGNYTFSWDSDNSYFQIKVCYYDKNKTFLSGASYGENNVYSKILEIPEGTKYTRICYSINVNGNSVTRENIKLEKGTVKTSYSNYNQGSIKLSVKNQNFLSNLKKTNTSSGLNNSFDNGVFSSKGIATQTWSMITIGTDLYLKAGTYALSISNLDYALEFRCHMSNGVSKSIWLDHFNLKRSGVFDYDITSISLIYYNYKVGDSIDFTCKMQFEPGATFNSIITPKGQEFLIPVQQELLNGDKIDKTEYHTWKKIIFTGDEALSLERINDYDIANILYKLPENELGINFQILSNSFVAQNTLIAATQTEGIYLNETSIYFRIDAAIAQDSTRFKNWLKEKYNAGTPVVVYYKLKEPQSLELTAEQKEVVNKIKKCEFYDNITYVNNDIREGQTSASLDIEYFNPSYLLSIIKPYVNNLIGGGEN